MQQQDLLDVASADPLPPPPGRRQSDSHIYCASAPPSDNSMAILPAIPLEPWDHQYDSWKAELMAWAAELARAPRPAAEPVKSQPREAYSRTEVATGSRYLLPAGVRDGHAETWAPSSSSHPAVPPLQLRTSPREPAEVRPYRPEMEAGPRLVAALRSSDQLDTDRGSMISETGSLSASLPSNAGVRVQSRGLGASIRRLPPQSQPHATVLSGGSGQPEMDSWRAEQMAWAEELAAKVPGGGTPITGYAPSSGSSNRASSPPASSNSQASRTPTTTTSTTEPPMASGFGPAPERSIPRSWEPAPSLQAPQASHQEAADLDSELLDSLLGSEKRRNTWERSEAPDSPGSPVRQFSVEEEAAPAPVPRDPAERPIRPQSASILEEFLGAEDASAPTAGGVIGVVCGGPMEPPRRPKPTLSSSLRRRESPKPSGESTTTASSKDEGQAAAAGVSDSTGREKAAPPPIERPRLSPRAPSPRGPTVGVRSPRSHSPLGQQPPAASQPRAPPPPPGAAEAAAEEIDPETANWFAGLRGGAPEAGQADDPLIFGSGFKATRRRSSMPPPSRPQAKSPFQPPERGERSEQRGGAGPAFAGAFGGAFDATPKSTQSPFSSRTSAGHSSATTSGGTARHSHAGFPGSRPSRPSRPDFFSRPEAKPASGPQQPGHGGSSQFSSGPTSGSTGSSSWRPSASPAGPRARPDARPQAKAPPPRASSPPRGPGQAPPPSGPGRPGQARGNAFPGAGAKGGSRRGSQPTQNASVFPDAVKVELRKIKALSAPAERKKAFLQLCFQWHPDKNPENTEFATKVFQSLQEKKKAVLL
eukprot:TRINITY_DN4743_c0_g1_i1.p1 TRINITY_DN4743_c0_g1~~TRINITY_DN4743_c0_g1_i1.p1  ORF type:complete len:818 (+),score=115.92 TRINITY_DN4743_c0_g1_i1:103-2556(+)